MIKKLTIIAAIGIALAVFAGTASAQDWFKTGTGLGVTKARVAVPEFAIRTATPPALEKTFHDVLWADLDYCGILELVSPSFYPTQIPSQPSDVKFADWASAPANTYMLAYGSLSVWLPQDICRTCTIPRRPSRCRKSIEALPPMMARASWRINSPMTSSGG
jgi:hypothetical protein